MLHSVLLKSIGDRSRATIIAVAILAFYVGLAMAAYNTMSDDIIRIYESMPPAMAQIYGTNDGTALGLATGAVFALMAPVVILSYSISGGVGAAVGEEKRGSLDLLLSNPVSRSGVVVPKSLVALAGTVIIGFGTWLTVIGVAAMLGEDAGNLDVFSASMMLIGLAVMFGGLAAAVAGWTGRSGAGIGVATGVAAVSWFVTSVLSIEPSLETLSKLTPWYLYSGSDPIFNGIGWWQLAVMVGSGIVLALLGVVGVNRRDLKG